jgi:hypothetical protein
MYSNSALNEAGFLLLGLALGCGRVNSSPADASPSASSHTQTNKRTFGVQFESGPIFDHAPTLFRLDFANYAKMWKFGERYPGTNHYQLDGVRTSAERPCDSAFEKDYNEILKDNQYPVDTGFVGSVRIDIVTSGGAPKDTSALCFAAHIAGAAWKWNFARVPIVVDSGKPGDVRGPAGSGHYSFDVKTDKVDLLAFMQFFPASVTQQLISKITYTVIPQEATSP